MNDIKMILLDEARDFLASLPQKARIKMLSVLNQVRGGSRDPRLFKKLEGTDIWEFRAEYESNAYRMLAFWDKEERSLVIATHGFMKKNQKTPRKEIEKAEQMRKKYIAGK